MTYPGNPELSTQAQERIMSAFRQVITKIQEGLSNEALIGLEFVLRLDPTFAPGIALQKQLVSGQPDIDLSGIISEIDTPDTGAVNLLLIEAVEEFNQHNYLEAKEKIEKILIDLPGHQEARNLATQIEDALKVATQVGQFLTQAKEALAESRPQDAANFVLMAQALDPHHRGIESTLAEIHRSTGVNVPALSQPPEAPAAPPLVNDPTPGGGDIESPGGFSTMFVDPAQSEESDSWDVASAFEEPAFEPVEAAAPEVEPESFNFGGDVADLFEASSDAPLWDKSAPASQAEVGASGPEDELLVLGTTALEGGDPEDALQHFSKVLVINPDNSQAEALIDRARSAIDALEHQLQSSLSEAEMALDSGDKDRARAVVDEILLAAPNNEDAQALQARIASEALEAPLPPPPPASPGSPDDPIMQAPPDDSSSLLEDPLLDLDTLDDFSSSFDSLESEDSPATGRPVAPSSGGRQAPWRLIILGAGGVSVVLLGMWLGSAFLPKGEDDIDTARAVSERIENAQTLFGQGKGEEALALLRSFDVEGIDKARIEKHITRIEAALVPPEPTPIPESVQTGRSLMDEGKWLEAYNVVTVGLSQHPGDSGLLDLKQQITEFEPDLSGLFGALEKDDYQSGVHLAEALAGRHTDQEGFSLILDRCLFNAALDHLRAYNLTTARGYLRRLQERHPDDGDVARILEFISSYTNRPVDMQLEIFIGSLGFR